ncbi:MULTISPECIES: hypothetical protein [Streptomyces]|uniref:hypothetical protein n=1 Tax=Streptomyces TaxID=1883 RepID=UPI0004CD94BA|nr:MULTISPECIES: hypothetical protein [Streptomyces]
MAKRGADIEIIERCTNADEAGVLVPNEIRINGASVVIPAGANIRIHDITDSDLVTVTLTVFARSISIRAEDA